MKKLRNVAISITAAGLLACSQTTALSSADAGQEDAGQEDAVAQESGDASGSFCNAFSYDDQACLEAGCVMARNMDTGKDVCIEPDLCRGLEEDECVTTPGCAAVKGYLAGDPQRQRVFVGCATGRIPGALVTCTSAGPGEPCFVISGHWGPDGWEFWGCSGKGSQVECLVSGPYAVDSGSGDGGPDS